MVNALAALTTDAGGTVTAGVDVDQILVEGRRATSVVTADGSMIRARRAVIASVTPTALYGKLLRGAQLSGDTRESARRFRYGNGCMIIHLAMSEPPKWKNDNARLSQAAVVHINGDVADISLARCQAANNTLPTKPMIAFGQPVALDPSRAPAGSSIGWMQLLDTPYRPLRDSADQIATDGQWTLDVRERYADRVADILRDHIENIENATLARVCHAPPDLEARNANLAFGDPYSGATQLDQSLIYRPGTSGHRTSIAGLWHIGASTHPGPGLGAGSGWIVARSLTKHQRTRRKLQKQERDD